MNLKDFLTNRDKPPELYWSIALEQGWVQAGVWYIGENEAEMVCDSPPSAWEVDSELVGAVDAALSSSIQKLPENYPEPSKTVFGVPSSWVSEGEIKEEFLKKIKDLCTALSLSPVGFVVLPEAIAHLYKSEEGAPLNAIVVGLGDDSLEITVFKLGNLIGTTQVARSVSIVEDVSEGLARFEGASPLPSRFIIYDGKGGELAEAKDELTKASWEEVEKVKFLHTPNAEILTPEKKVLATSLAGANEIGNVSQISTNEVEKEIPPEVENVSTPAVNDISPESLGFSIGEDVSVQEENLSPMSPIQNPTPIPTVQTQPIPLTQPAFDSGKYIEKTKNVLHSFSGLFASKTVAPGAANKKMSYILLSILGALILSGLTAWWFLPKAVVTIYVSSKKFNQDVSLKFNTDGTSDPSNGIIPATTLDTEISGSKTQATTGTKLIGDNAKGTVQIANGSPVSIDLPAGTVIVSSGSLNFTTNAEASVSGQILPGSPGTGTVEVTASDIGSQYNLAKGEVFSVGNYLKAQVAATATVDFSGGSSQQISAVSADDQKNIEDALKNELSQTAISQLSGKILQNQMFINGLAAVDVKSENFDHQIGDEANNLKLSLDLNATGVAADKTKLYEYARGVLKDKIPSGYVLRDSQIGFNFTFVDKKDGNLNYKANISANFLPQINSDEIVNKIAGKSTTVAQNYLTVVQGFSRASVTLKPSLPGFLGTLPHVGKNISIEVVSE